MPKFSTYRAVLSLLFGVLGYQILASGSLLAQSPTRGRVAGLRR